jgi:ATP-dependent exoDNAse (exonuclease V) beta subunit
MIFNVNGFDSLIELEEHFKHIRFFEKNHSYIINGEVAPYSVTKLLKKYEVPFDEKTHATRVANKEGFDVQDILDRWAYYCDYANHKGTEFHNFAENFLQKKQLTIDLNSLEMFLQKNLGQITQNDITKYYNEFALIYKNFLNFYKWWNENYILIRSEFVIGDNLKKVCGTIDNLSLNKKTKELAIFDYKTNKEIKRKSKYKEKLLPPYDYLDNCELVKYSLQLWLYKLILERNSPFDVSEMKILWVSGTNGYELIEPINLKKEAANILEDS